MTGAFIAAAVIIGISVLVGIFAVARSDHDATSAVVGDLLFFCAVGIFLLLASLSNSAVVFDVALLSAMLGILATLALARMLTKGKR